MILWIIVSLVFVALVIGGVWMAKQASHKEQEAFETKSRSRAFKQLYLEIEEIQQTLFLFDGDEHLLRTLGSYRLHLMNQRLALIPGDNETLSDISIATEYLNNLAQQLEGHQAGIPENDRQLSLLRKHFARAIKWLHKLSATQHLSEMEASNHISRIKIQLLKKEVQAYLRQGNNAKDNNDRITAANYYKHAKEQLVASDLSFPEKTEMIKNIAKMIQNLYANDEDGVAEA